MQVRQWLWPGVCGHEAESRMSPWMLFTQVQRCWWSFPRLVVPSAAEMFSYLVRYPSVIIVEVSDLKYASVDE